jgi:hypothetical protein
MINLTPKKMHKKSFGKSPQQMPSKKWIWKHVASSSFLKNVIWKTNIKWKSPMLDSKLWFIECSMLDHACALHYQDYANVLTLKCFCPLKCKNCGFDSKHRNFFKNTTLVKKPNVFSVKSVKNYTSLFLCPCTTNRPKLCSAEMFLEM